jgi:ribosomal protein S17
MASSAMNKRRKLMEYVIVKYLMSRTVLVDDEKAGFTNKILRMEEGTHTFELDGAKDYKPLSQTLEIKRTDSVHPKEVTFEKA